MVGVLEGFATIAIIVAVGWLLADRARPRRVGAQVNLSRLAFHVASPALLLTVMQRTSLDVVLSANLVDVTHQLRSRSSPSTCPSPDSVGRGRHARVTTHRKPLCGLRQRRQPRHPHRALRPRRHLVDRPDPAHAAAHHHARLHGALRQRRAGERPTLLRSVRRMFSNPITLGAIAGLLIAVFDIDLPRVVSGADRPARHMAVPSMLVAFGISLRRGPRPAAGKSAEHVWTIVVLKTLRHAGDRARCGPRARHCAARPSSPSS